METDTRPDRRARPWDCRLCNRANEAGRDICGYCGNPESANRTLPPLPWRPEIPRLPRPRPPHIRPRRSRVRPYVLARPGAFAAGEEAADAPR
ncbi:hypothetical protein FZ103_24290 [Streptomonospora sp. PA3]|uniref:hypothetical protein n=1 Tax=Streptomonospora sp. PA3 TaxID=2607326 RepID=UPI0012DD2759|nr:hypothetical protein [Streptomonospora sp. PA3]MUL44242.1 hypothetical protein [Streptomonospora sp. PA3]